MPSSNNSSLTDFAIPLYRYYQAGLCKNRWHSIDHLDHLSGATHHSHIRRTVGGDQYFALFERVSSLRPACGQRGSIQRNTNH
jgi:hypothetical protein